MVCHDSKLLTRQQRLIRKRARQSLKLFDVFGPEIANVFEKQAYVLTIEAIFQLDAFTDKITYHDTNLVSPNRSPLNLESTF